MKETRNEDNILILLQNEQQKPQAFEQLVKLYQEQLYWTVRRIVLYHDDANDVLQNTFIKAWRGLNNFRGESKISSWLYRIAVNEAISFLEVQRRKQNISIDEVDFLYKKMIADSYFDGDELQTKLQQAILTLPEKQRLVFNLKYFEEMKYEEMEKILKTSVGALKASYHHAVKKIEAFFNNQVME